MSGHTSRFWIRKSRFGWWVAVNPDEILGEFDGHSYYRSFSREKLVRKMRGRLTPKPTGWEEIKMWTAP